MTSGVKCEGPAHNLHTTDISSQYRRGRKAQHSCIRPNPLADEKPLFHRLMNPRAPDHTTKSIQTPFSFVRWLCLILIQPSKSAVRPTHRLIKPSQAAPKSIPTRTSPISNKPMNPQKRSHPCDSPKRKKTRGVGKQMSSFPSRAICWDEKVYTRRDSCGEHEASHAGKMKILFGGDDERSEELNQLNVKMMIAGL